ncbi:MAG: porin family protein [Flavisolibacter sp.]
MKIRLFSFSILAILISASSNAQSARLVAGVNLANVSVTDNGRVDDAKMLTSFRLGVIGDLPIAGIVSFQPGLLYTGKGSKVQNGNEGDVGYYKQTFNPTYIEVPMNLVFKTPAVKSTRFFAGAGPYVAIGVAGKVKTTANFGVGISESERNITFSNDDPTTFNEEEGTGFGVIKRFDYGLNGTAGIEGKSIVLSVDYGLGLAKLQSGSNSSADNNNKHRVLGFTLGFKF